MGSDSKVSQLKKKILKLERALQDCSDIQHELINQKQQFDAVFDNAPAEIYLKDFEGRYLKINKQFEKIFSVRNEDLVGKLPESAHDPELAASTRNQDLAVLKTGQPVSREAIALLPIDNQLHSLLTIKFPIFDTAGKVNGLGAVVTDITEQKLAEERFRTIFMSAPVGMVLTEGRTGEIIEVNPAYSQITGRDIDEIRRAGWDSYTHPDDIQKDRAYIELLYDGGVPGEKLTKRFIQPDNTVVWVELSMTPISTSYESGKKQYLTVFEDITERRQIEEKVWYQANYDFLTGLPNRNMLQDRLSQIIKRYKRNGAEFALLLIDLDEFKEVNDRLGHDQGDILLVEAAKRIKGCMRDSDTVARLGGDEFVIILGKISSKAGVRMVAKNINQVLEEKFILGGESAQVSASIGITLFPHDGDENIALIRNADQAMYESKRQGRNQYQFFTQSIAKAAAARLRSNQNPRSPEEE